MSVFMSPPTKYLCIAVNCSSRFHAFSKLIASLKTSCERSVGTRYQHWLFVLRANDRGVIETTCARSYSTCNCSLEDQTSELIMIILMLKKPSLDKNLLKNYRPISNLPFLSKILEKVVLHKLLSHLQENNLSNPFQSAYRSGCSTETVLLRIVNDILSALDNDNISVLLLLDLSAAFDTLDHQILLSRLNSVFGIQSTALQWFHSYLSDRYQSTSVNNSSSSPSQLMFGVPQGSVLGPILFVLYTAPLSDIIANHSVNHQLFADDTQLQKSSPLNEVTNLTKELNACTDNIKTWMTENQLKLNDDKTEALLFPFSSSLKPSTVPLPDSITLGSHNIPFSNSARNLGFILDSKLFTKKHIIKICQTAYFELKRISSIRRFLTEDATKTLVTSYILSRLDYCNCLLMGTPNSVIQPLQKIQNFAARLVLLAPRHHHATPLLEKLHWLPISERIKYKVACMCFSAINGSGPAYLSDGGGDSSVVRAPDS